MSRKDQRSRNPSKVVIRDQDDLTLIYSPELEHNSRDIISVPGRDRGICIKKNTVAIVSDGSSLSQKGELNLDAALALIEKKALLFKEYADIDAFPICVNTHDVDEIVRIVKNVLPVFAGINLEDIAASKGYSVESALANVGIPVYQDVRQGSAITLLAALLNATILAGKKLSQVKIVINGANLDSLMFVQLLLESGFNTPQGNCLGNILVTDNGSILSRDRDDLKDSSLNFILAGLTNLTQSKGTTQEALFKADILIDFSKRFSLTEADLKRMAPKPAIFDLTKESKYFSPEMVRRAGAFVVASKSEHAFNYLDHELAFPGIFRGALDCGAPVITKRMGLAAALSLAECVDALSVEHLLPEKLDKQRVLTVAQSVKTAFEEELSEDIS